MINLDRVIYPFLVKYPKLEKAIFKFTHQVLEFILRATPLIRRPKFSIVVPVYQHADYLESCIRSALNQDYPDFELILVDDGSPDPRVTKILAAFADHPKVTLSRNAKNSGISITQNSGVQLAKNEWIAFLDCDDQLVPQALRWVAKSINLHPSARYFFSDRVKVDEVKNDKTIEYYGGTPRSFLRPIAFREKLLRNMIASHLKVIHKKSYWAVGGSDLEICGIQDWDTALKLSTKASFAYVPKPIYLYRWHSSSNTISQKQKLYRLTNITRRRALIDQFGQRTLIAGKEFLIDGFLDLEEELLIASWKNATEPLTLCVSRRLTSDEIHKLGILSSYFDQFQIADAAKDQIQILKDTVWNSDRVTV